MPGHKPNMLTQGVAGAAAALWIVTFILLVALISTHPRGFTSLAAVEIFMGSLALAATMVTVFVCAWTQRAFYFDQGYLACAADMRDDERVVSIASCRIPRRRPVGDRRNSNKVL